MTAEIDPKYCARYAGRHNDDVIRVTIEKKQVLFDY